MNRHLIAFIGCLILVLIGFGFFLGLNQAGAVSTMDGDVHQTAIDCSNCHTLNNQEVAPGTMGIKQSAADTVIYPPGRLPGDPFPCEFCHRTAGGFPDTPATNFDKQLGFNHTFMSYTEDAALRMVQDVSKGPSGHPIYSFTYRLDTDGLDNDGDGTIDETGEKYDPLIQCTNCHDKDITTYPTHEFYNYITKKYSPQARLLARTPVGSPLTYLDPDPWDSTVVYKGSMLAWNASHTPGSSPPVVDYELYPTETNQPFASFDFCLTCHDADGFPKNPYDSSQGRIPGRVYYAKPLPGTVPDIKSLWENEDMPGHYIRQTTGVILKQNDKIPCSVCHFSHYSPDNVSLLNNTVADPATMDASGHTRIEVCLRCHDANRDGSSNLIVGIPMLEGLYELVPPPSNEGRPIPEHTLPYSGINSCLSNHEIDNPLNNGCHMSPHSPQAYCGACHYEEGLGATGGYGEGAKVAHKMTAKERKEAERGVSEDYYSSHPVNISLDINTPDIAEIKQHYFSRPERLLSPDPVPLGIGNSVYCTTCHNHHGNKITDTTVGVVAGDAKNDDQAVLRLPFPLVCLQCHNKIEVDDGLGGTREVNNPHGGFSSEGAYGGGAGMCNKCHSMHGRHPYSSSPSSPELEYSLHYGMYGAYNTTWENLIDVDTGVYEDATGKQYTKSRNSHLIHYANQYELCGKCHGAEPPPFETLDRKDGPPNVYFPHASNNYRQDTYFRSPDWASNPERTNSTHPVDLGSNTPWGEPVNVQLRCASCHNPHGSDNYVQLRETIKIGQASLGQTVKLVSGIRVNAYYDTNYEKMVYLRTSTDSQGEPSLSTDGMVQFCTACHTGLGEFYYDPDTYDTSLYQRHPMNVEISRLNVTIYNFDQLILQNKTTNPNDGEVFCITCHSPHGSDELKLRRFQRTESCQLYCHVEIVSE